MSCSRFSTRSSLRSESRSVRSGAIPTQRTVRRTNRLERYPGIYFKLMKCPSEGLDQRRFLLREDGPQVEDEAIIFNAGDHRYAGGSAAQPLFEFRRRVARAGDPNDFCW